MTKQVTALIDQPANEFGSFQALSSKDILDAFGGEKGGSDSTMSL
jgi:hypothetical protein